MAQQPSSLRVSFSDELSFQEVSTEDSSDFDYVESTSEAVSSDEEQDLERLELVLGAMYSSSPSKERDDPALRQSLLLLDKDLSKKEALEAGRHLCYSLCS